MSSDGADIRALGDFQTALLVILLEGGPLVALRDRVQRTADACGFGDYARSFDDRMLVVASELVGKWGARVPRA